jgi:ribonuclease BN (tRNA processing enzyme)
VRRRSREEQGIVYQDSNVKVMAFLVKHGEVSGAFGYRFETPDRIIVISGDAAPSQTVIDQCNGCDVLIHEAYSLMTYNDVTRPYQEYREKHHTSSRELAELATKARPGLLILYHRANPGGVGRPNPEDALLEELRAHCRRDSSTNAPGDCPGAARLGRASAG